MRKHYTHSKNNVYNLYCTKFSLEIQHPLKAFFEDGMDEACPWGQTIMDGVLKLQVMFMYAK